VNILITGASGFIGQHLLKEEGLADHDISIMTRSQNKKDIFPPKNKIVIADLTDYLTLEKAFKNIDIIINIAAEVRNLENLESTNIQGSKNLMKAAIFNGVKKIIHLSSVGVVGMQYSNNEIIIDEDSVCAPNDNYEKTKLKSEEILLKSCSMNNIQLSILRPTNVYGENHPFNAVLKLMNHINQDKTMILAKGAKVNYIYVADLTAAIVKLIEMPQQLILNIGNTTTYKNLILILDEILLKNTKVIILPNVIFKVLNAFGINKLNVISNKVVYDDSKLSLLFTYPFGIKKGMKNTYINFKKNRLIK